MKINSKMLNISLKKVLLSTALVFGAMSFSQAATSDEQKNLEEGKIEIEIQGLKELPTITLVDKDLKIIAEFYGNTTEVKKQFESTFSKAEFIAKYNNRSIYLMSER